MRLRPVHDLVIIKAIERKQTSSGLHLPDNREADREPGEGEVLAVGPGRTTDNGTLIIPTVEAGQRVFFRRYVTLHSVDVDGERYLLVPAGEILAVLEPK